MTIQDALSNKQDALRRHLFDLNIKRGGREFDAVRITSEEFDMYGNAMSEVMEQQERISLIINYPVEIPLERIRANIGATPDSRLTVTNTSTFFFDILPIELYAQFSDHVEKEDYIIHRLGDENGNQIPVILKITEPLGSFGRTLVWRKYLAAPYTDIISPELADVITNGDLI